MSSAESDRLWVWICGSAEGGGFIRGDLLATARALQVTPRSLSRILSGPSPLLRQATIRRLMKRLDELERAEAMEAGRLARLAWSEVDDTARDERDRWYARYRASFGWAYVTGTGQGYASAAEARFVASKMRFVAAPECAAE